jgi:hypothetical protein
MNATVEQIEQLPAVSTPMQMLQLAVDRGATIDVLAKLMDLQERVDATQARREFDAAFAAVKAKVGTIKKTGVGHNRMPYADLADIAQALDPVIAEQGLSYRFRSQRVGNELVMTCIVCHRAGHFEENSLPGPLDTSGSKNPIQAVGSTCTYLQRYTLIQAFGLSASVNGGEIKDDDGAGAAVKDNWPRGSVMEDGEYGVAHKLPGDRAKDYQLRLGSAENVSDLDATANTIEKEQAYIDLPQALKNNIAKTYAQVLARIKGTAPKTYSKKAAADQVNEQRLSVLMGELDELTKVQEPLEQIFIHLHDWRRERGQAIAALGDVFEAKLLKAYAETLAVVSAEIDRSNSKKPEPAPPPEHKPNGISQRAIDARHAPPRLLPVSADGSFFDSATWLEMLTNELRKATKHEDFDEIKDNMLTPAKDLASRGDWLEGTRRYYQRLQEFELAKG